MPELQFPTWTGSGGAADGAWRTCWLGGVQLPGIVTINGLKCGIDVKTKKAKGQDAPNSTDNGVEPSKFSIEVWLNEKHWPLWLAVVGKIHPRRVGRQRQPVEIIHPEPNVFGINQVRIISINGFAPTAKAGKKYRIECEEWFDEPKPVNKKKAEVPVPIAKTSDYFGDPNELARKLAKGAGYIVLPNPEDENNIANQLFVNSP